MLILGIDTSGKMASVSIMEDDILLAENTVYTTLTHSQIIMPMCKKLLKSANKTLKDVDRIAVSCGPGSYTGLRIGIAGVKAMTFALDIGCNGVSTLESLAYNVSHWHGNICAIMKARQDLVYCGLFHSYLGEIKRHQEDFIINRKELWNLLNTDERFSSDSIILVGDGAKDFYDEFNDHEHKLILSSIKDRFQSASSLCEVAKRLEPQSPYDLEAFYLQPTKAEKDLKSKL